MQKVRWLDKLIDELAKGRPLERLCASSRQFILQKTSKNYGFL